MDAGTGAFPVPPAAVENPCLIDDVSRIEPVILVSPERGSGICGWILAKRSRYKFIGGELSGDMIGEDVS